MTEDTKGKRNTIPAAAGIGLRANHYREVLETRPPVAWWEVHSENYFGDGGAPHYYLERIRAHYPLSLHGVGLSLGSVDPLNRTHLEKLKRLIERYQPALVSDHVPLDRKDPVKLHNLETVASRAATALSMELTSVLDDGGASRSDRLACKWMRSWLSTEHVQEPPDYSFDPFEVVNPGEPWSESNPFVHIRGYEGHAESFFHERSF